MLVEADKGKAGQERRAWSHHVPRDNFSGITVGLKDIMIHSMQFDIKKFHSLNRYLQQLYGNPRHVTLYLS